ncbi:MAG: ABC transporter ATP-binding protein/permease [Blautia sp.]|nr:ABC transporter ATP-binding protein/permease [Blautia sp.]
MRKKGWVRENIREVKAAFVAHLLMNPLQYLCRTLLGAQGTAMMVLGLQYMDRLNLGKGMAVYMAGILAAALCGAADTVFQARVECGIRLRQKRELLRAVLYRKTGGRQGAGKAHGAGAQAWEKQSCGRMQMDGKQSHNAAAQGGEEPLHSAKLQEILITDVENIVGFFGTQISNCVTPVAVSLVCIGAVFTKSGIIAFIVLFSMLLAALINLYFLPKLHAQIREVREAENGLTARYTDTILGSAVIRVFSCQKYYLETIGRDIRSVLDTQAKEVRIRFLQGLALNLLSFSSMTIPFLAGAVLTVMGRMDLSTMIYITQLSGNLLWFINTFSSTVTEMQRTRISRERIESALGQDKESSVNKVHLQMIPANSQRTRIRRNCPKQRNEKSVIYFRTVPKDRQGKHLSVPVQDGNMQEARKPAPAKDEDMQEAHKPVPAKGEDMQETHKYAPAKDGDMQKTHKPASAKGEDMQGAHKLTPAKNEDMQKSYGSDCAVRLERLNVWLGGRQILKDISLEVPRGACVAFVGESGCGKSTIFKALQNFVPYQGRISLFGKDADSMEEDARYGLMSLVSQDVGLMGGTIYENILIGNQNAAPREVEEAAGLAQADRFVHGLEAGLDTEIGENGSMLSGGERQRVALARGFLKNAPILMLDEVTSALDPETEAGVVAAVGGFRGRCTILIIAQKLDTIRNADRIFCIKDGEIAGQGTHEELMENCAEYRRLALAGADKNNKSKKV